MAEKEVLFEDNMETQAQDFDNLQEYIGDSIDHIVDDAITGTTTNYYTGLTISKVASTQISIAIGRLYWGGFVYILEDPVVIDFQSISGAMPVTQQRQIAIVAWGSTIQTDTQPRNFVVDADTGQAQPQSVSMTSIRLCNVGPIPGVEAPNPNYPAVPATNLLVGYVLMNPSGVVSIQQYVPTQLPNLGDIENRVNALETEWGLVQGQISTLQTALAALSARFANYVTLDTFQKLVDLVNTIWLLINKPPSLALDSVDNFYDTSQSAVGTNLDGAYNAVISSGLRFPGGGSATTSLQLYNPTEPIIQSWSTYILPKPSGTRNRMDCSFPDLDWVAESVLNHPYWVFSPRQLGWARERHRCGTFFLPAPQGPIFVNVGGYDPVYLNLRFDAGETWIAVVNSTVVQYPAWDPDYPRWDNYRYKYFWRDWVDVPYWSKTYNTLNCTGNLYGQSFLNAQDGWLSGITVFSMQPGFYQPLQLIITQCDDQGVPDHTSTIGSITLDATAVQNCYQNAVMVGDIRAGAVTALQVGGNVIWETGPDGFWVDYPVYAYPVRINFNPVFLAAGKRYAFHVVSTFAHQFAVTSNPSCYSVHQGDFWDYDGSKWFRVGFNGFKTLRFMLHYLVWGQWQGAPQPGGQLRYPVQLQPLQLGGGIASVDVLADHIVPEATDLSYAVQVSGKWIPFAGDPDTPAPIGASTPLLPFEVIFTGTTDLMPGVSLVNSQVKLTGPPATGFYHISTNIPRGGPTATGITVKCNVTGFNATNHNLTCALRYGATHNTTDVIGSALLADGVTTQFTFAFSPVTGVSNYQIELTGTTNGTGDNYVVSQRSAFSG